MWIDKWQHGYVKTNGIKLHYVTAGAGELMLMLHGFPEFWYSWRHQIDEFSEDYKVVALDLRGYNDSDKPAGVSAYTMATLIEDIRGVINGLGYGTCILVAHDWGGAIAWHFAYVYPDMVSKLIVMNLPHPAKFSEGLSTPKQLLKSWYIFFFQIPWLPEQLLAFNDYRAIAAAFTEWAIDKSAFTAEDIAAFKDAASRRGALTAMLNYYRNIFQSGAIGSRTWSAIKIPTLMIWGENDAALGKELTYGTELYVKDLTLKYIPNCSHWVQQEQPKLVNQYMREFLTAIS
ncbi:alpha/beta fold hydrolase [Pseudanabaena sp. PCC 6802]|uniref:alpha/beta fold hydrolase n=1 Tax=Pseudanabaena sp. PCC 6802 TaxID=118173 RepID=UPI000371C586|nr:alpha/beta hydrolase [Pseudanabaena sp. PCC 6802]